MSITTTTIIFQNATVLASSDLCLHFSGDFVRVTNNESNTLKFYKSSDIRTITETTSKKTVSAKSGRQARITISGQIIETSGSISSSGSSFISINDGSTITWIPYQMFDCIEIFDDKQSVETAKLTKMLPITLAKGVDSASVKRGDSFTVTTNNRVLDVNAGWMKPEGNFLFVRDYTMNTEFWIPSRLVLEIDFKS